jgi:hypothetical protein
MPRSENRPVNKYATVSGHPIKGCAGRKTMAGCSLVSREINITGTLANCLKIQATQIKGAQAEPGRRVTHWYGTHQKCGLLLENFDQV